MKHKVILSPHDYKNYNALTYPGEGWFYREDYEEICRDLLDAILKSSLLDSSLCLKTEEELISYMSNVHESSDLFYDNYWDNKAPYFLTFCESKGCSENNYYPTAFMQVNLKALNQEGSMMEPFGNFRYDQRIINKDYRGDDILSKKMTVSTVNGRRVNPKEVFSEIGAKVLYLYSIPILKEYKGNSRVSSFNRYYIPKNKTFTLKELRDAVINTQLYILSDIINYPSRYAIETIVTFELSDHSDYFVSRLDPVMCIMFNSIFRSEYNKKFQKRKIDIEGIKFTI